MRANEANIGDIVTSKSNSVKSKYEIVKLKKTVCWVKWLCWHDGSTDHGPAKVYKNVPYRILTRINQPVSH